jgi:hypothetical protein
MIVVPRKLKFLILMIKLNSSSKLRYKANAVNNMVSVENNSFQISILMMMVKLVQLDSDSLTLQLDIRMISLEIFCLQEELQINSHLNSQQLRRAITKTT